MRPAFGIIGLLLVGLTSEAANQDKKAPPKLDGTYVIIGMEMGGDKLPAELLTKAPEADRTITIKGDKLIAMKGGKEDSVTAKFDPSKTPAEITTTEVKPGGKTETTYGIYKLENDVLTICMVESEKATDRPKEFKTTKDSKAMILTLKKK